MKHHAQYLVLLGGLILTLCAVFFLWPLIHGRPSLSSFAREKRTAENNLQQTSLALHAYRDRYGRFPADMDQLIPGFIQKRLINPWVAVESDSVPHDWGYISLLASDVLYEGNHVLLIATDGKHGAWLLIEQDNRCFWISDQSRVDTICRATD